MKNIEENIQSSLAVLKIFENTKRQLAKEVSVLLSEIDSEKEEISKMKAMVAKNVEYIALAEENLNNKKKNALRSRENAECDTIREEISNLEKKRLSLLENPIIVAGKARKSLINEHDIMSALGQIKKLTDILSQKEFMNIDYNDEFSDNLVEILKNAEADRNNIAREIESKNYLDDNLRLDEERSKYLDDRIKFYEVSVKSINTIISNIIDKNNEDCANNLSKIGSAINNIEDKIASYENIDENLKLKKSEIIALTNKKEAQIETAKTSLAAYQKDMVFNELLAGQLERQTIEPFEIAIRKAKEELRAIESRVSMKLPGDIDIVEQAVDQAKLEFAINRVRSIKERQKFDLSPRQIFEKISNLLGSNLEPVEEEITIDNFDDPNLNDISEVIFEPSSFVEIDEPVENNEIVVEDITTNDQDISDIRGFKVLNVEEVEIEQDNLKNEEKELVEDLDNADKNKYFSVVDDDVFVSSQSNEPISLNDDIFKTAELNLDSISRYNSKAIDMNGDDTVFNFNTAFANLDVE